MQISHISSNQQLIPTARSGELISSFPCEIIETFFMEMSSMKDRQNGACVCKDWQLSSLHVMKILSWPLGTDSNPEMPFLMAPKSLMPKAMEKDIFKFANQRCPLNPKKAIHETHFLVYLGSTICENNLDLYNIYFRSLYGKDDIYKPLSAHSKMLSFDDGLKNTAAWASSISKPKWIAIPKQPFAIKCDHGQEVELSKDQIEKIEKAKAQGYRKLNALELVHSCALGHINERLNYAHLKDNYERPWMLDPLIRNDYYNRTCKVVTCEDIEKDGTILEYYLTFKLYDGLPVGKVISKQSYKAEAQEYIEGIMLGKEFDA